MKRRSSLATLVGAVPGALPPLIGWTASHGGISLGGAALFAIVFLWQIPHFMAIAWLYRDDYGKAGFPDAAGHRARRTPHRPAGGDLRGRRSCRSASCRRSSASAALLYCAIALVLGVALLWLAVRFAATRSDESARALFFGSIIYLPLLWIAMIANKL